MTRASNAAVDKALAIARRYADGGSVHARGGEASQVSKVVSKVPAKAPSLYDRLGGVFAIAAAVDHFSDALIENPIVGRNSKNPHLRKWHEKVADRLPGLKWMRTLWVCDVTGGPFRFKATRPGRTRLGLEEAHRALRISPAEFDEVAAELGRTLDHVGVPRDVKAKVLAAFAAHRSEVTAGHGAKGSPVPMPRPEA